MHDRQQTNKIKKIITPIFYTPSAYAHVHYISKEDMCRISYEKHKQCKKCTFSKNKLSISKPEVA
jgi:hypothetical protein